MKDLSDVTKILSALTSVAAVSGEEYKLFDAIGSFFEEKSERDALNSVIFETNGDAEVSFLLDAHIDQIGFVVTDITEGGFVKVGAVGGIDARTLCATDVMIHAEGGDVFGVVTSVPPHLSGKNEGEAAEVTDIMIDIGMDKDNAEKAVSRGDTVSFRYECRDLLNDRIVSPSLDNRAGAAVLIRVYQLLKSACPAAKVRYQFSSQEEAGMRGAKPASFGVKADEAIVVDVSFSTAPNVDKLHAGELGKGPMICISPVVEKSISDGLINVAKLNNIDFQTEICSGGTGTNADVISISGMGIKTGLVSVPLRNMHTFSEVIYKGDVELCAQLIAEYIKRRVCSDD
ncbi:MAG: M42 family peptidase [Clostridia bacterium]|nr:M42 family peptidase [Clostridia bacterium]